MKKGTQWSFLMVLSVFLVLSLTGCAKGPTNEEALKAVEDTGLFAGGVEKFTLQSPMVIVDKGSRNKDGSWPVKVKFTATYKMTGGKETAPAEKTSTFNIYKKVDAAGKITWTAR